MSLNFPHSIEIQKKTRTHIGGGAYSETWQTSIIVWANCQVMNVTNDEAYNKKQQFTKWKVAMRYLPILTNQNRILFNTKVLKIEGVSNITNRNTRTIAICEEEVIRV